MLHVVGDGPGGLLLVSTEMLGKLKCTVDSILKEVLVKDTDA